MHSNIIFCESLDLAILSGSLALHRAKQRAKRFWWFGFMRLPVFAG
ncbi:MAG: hypothetical protein GDA36_12935 [Rhodobacteraceae bacterium]|nr:hypothetical protein [Paracoccaceae bacterium]